tara:strand:+ start:279 stop:1106 length:828 start_codon:yes stop_codon:yes gene_type:complete
MEYTTTLITALYDIKRNSVDTSSSSLKTLQDYYVWFKKTLQINAPMVIYTEEISKSFILEHRPSNYPTKIIIQTLETIPYYNYYSQIETILKLSEYKSKIKDPNRIECLIPEYNIIQYSKFEWLKETAHQNYFKTNYFMWIDAGISRFFPSIYNPKKVFPQINGINLLKKQKFVIQGRNIIYQINNVSDTDFIWNSINLMIGTMFGGTKESIQIISKKINDCFQTIMLKNMNVNNEQLALALVWKHNPELFTIFYNHWENKGLHLPLFIYMATNQ